MPSELRRLALPLALSCSLATAAASAPAQHGSAGASRTRPGAAPAGAPANASTPFRFATTHLDAQPGIIGWVLAGDVDLDGDPDLVGGGDGNLILNQNQGNASAWSTVTGLDGTGAIGANGGALHDVDDDGDLDVVSALYASDVGWWENPLRNAERNRPATLATSNPWRFHSAAPAPQSYMHDLVRTDLDQDGVAEEFVFDLDIGNHYWNAKIGIRWMRPGPDPRAPWEVHVIEGGPDGNGRPEGPSHGHAGLDVGDLDGDGDLDLAFANGWYESPGDPAGVWTWRPVSSVYGISNSLARDVDADGDLDLVVSAGHHGFGVYWYENRGAASRAWVERVVDSAVTHPEGLAVLDLDGDGVLEILAAELFFEAWTELVHNLYAYERVSGDGPWVRQSVASLERNPHLFQVVELDGDCKPDLVSQTAGDHWISVFLNRSELPHCP